MDTSILKAGFTTKTKGDIDSVTITKATPTTVFFNYTVNGVKMYERTEHLKRFMNFINKQAIND